MWIAIVPACNEALSIGSVVRNVFSTPVDLLLLVANGCTDQTCINALQAAKGQNLKILYFPQPLGIDVPKAIGAAAALQYKPKGLLFLDGDMDGPLQPVLADLVKTIENGADLALTNCYPITQGQSELAKRVLKTREDLNRRLGLFAELGVATPSHGPHAYSGSLLRRISLRNLAVPPKALAEAALLQAQIGVGASIPHNLLGSPLRTPLHAEKVAATIIGDCQEALTLLKHCLPDRDGINVPVAGYRGSRRFDILDRFLESTLSPDQI